MGEALHIRLLGSFRLLYGDAPVAGVEAPRMQSLLAYLALHRDAPQPRRHLAYTLWPDSDEPQARTNLRNLLYHLRRALPDVDRFVRLDAQELQWRSDAPFTLDVAQFESAARRAALEEAAALYSGDLLPNCYEDWAIPERERLQALYVSVLERLIRRLEERRDYRLAIAYARRLSLCDPLREKPYRDLMRLHALSGDRAAAIHAYHTCAATLQRELAVEPSAATRHAHERLLSEAKDPAEPASAVLKSVLPLVGRAQEWAELLAAWRAAAGGGPRMAALQGEAGIGKTRLAEELVAWVGRQGMHTASAFCYAPASALAYAPVAAWLRAGPLPPLQPAWLSEVARILPELLAQRPDLPPPGPLSEEWQRQRLYAALVRAVLTDRQPLLLVIEDLQWCDADTVAWLHYLLRSAAGARLLVLGTLRVGEAPPDGPLATLFASLRRDGLLAEIELGPLGEGETAELAAHAAGHPLSSTEAARLYADTEGNPLFVVESARALAAGGDAARPAGWPGGEGSGTALPPQVQAVLAARLDALSRTARELLGVAAVVGREFTFDVLRRASSIDEDALVRALDELWQRRIVRERGADGYDFSHQRLCEVAYSSLSSARRRVLHRRVAEALQALSTERPEVLAYHFEQAQKWEQAVRNYRLAGERAQQIYAHATALAHLDRALALARRARLGAEARFDILATREATLEVLGEQEAQARDLDAMAALASESLGPARLAEVRRRQARRLTALGRYDESEAAGGEALQLAEQAGDLAGQAAALVVLGHAADLRGEAGRAIPYLRAAIEIYDRSAPTTPVDRVQDARARYGLASALLAMRDYDAARIEAEAALAFCEAAGDRLGQAEALNILGIIGMEQGAFEDAVRRYRRSIETCHDIGYRYGEARALANWANILYVRGQLGEALARYDEAAAVFRTMGHRRGEAIVRLNTADIRLSAFGDAEGARKDTEAVLAYAREAGERTSEGQALTVLGTAAWMRGDLAEARRSMEASAAVLAAAREHWLEAQACISLIHVDLDEGQREAALAHLEAVEALCRERGMASLDGDLRAARGAVLLALGRLEEALAAAAGAEEQPGSGVQRTYLAPFVRYRILQALGRAEEARVALEQARAVVLDLTKGLSAEEQQLSLQQQPEFRAIVEAWQALGGT